MMHDGSYSVSAELCWDFWIIVSARQRIHTADAECCVLCTTVSEHKHTADTAFFDCTRSSRPYPEVAQSPWSRYICAVWLCCCQSNVLPEPLTDPSHGDETGLL